MGMGAFDGNGNLNLPGVDGYVDLGANLITGYTNLTIEAWGSFGTNAPWATLFSFGDTDIGTGNGAYGIDLVPHNDSGALHVRGIQHRSGHLERSRGFLHARPGQPGHSVSGRRL